MDRVRAMSAPSEKLVYLYLIQSQPQSFTTIQRALSLSSRTVDQAIRKLMEHGHVTLDKTYLYWVMAPRADAGAARPLSRHPQRPE